MKLYTVFFSLAPANSYDPPSHWYHRILARDGQDAAWRAYEREETRLRKTGQYDEVHDWLSIAAVVRGRHTCDED